MIGRVLSTVIHHYESVTIGTGESWESLGKRLISAGSLEKEFSFEMIVLDYGDGDTKKGLHRAGTLTLFGEDSDSSFYSANNVHRLDKEHSKQNILFHCLHMKGQS